MNSITHWADRAISNWRKEGIPLLSGVSMTYIAEVEQVLGFTFPPDFKELYTKVDGFAEGTCNQYLFSLWSIDRIYKAYLEEQDEDFIGFCDYMINSHAIGFHISEPGIYKSYDGTLMVAKSFSECIEMINADSALLY